MEHLGIGPIGQNSIDVAHVVWGLLSPPRFSFSTGDKIHQMVEASFNLQFVAQHLFEAATGHVKKNRKTFEPFPPLDSISYPRLFSEPLSFQSCENLRVKSKHRPQKRGARFKHTTNENRGAQPRPSIAAFEAMAWM